MYFIDAWQLWASMIDKYGKYFSLPRANIQYFVEKKVHIHILHPFVHHIQQKKEEKLCMRKKVKRKYWLTDSQMKYSSKVFICIKIPFCGAMLSLISIIWKKKGTKLWKISFISIYILWPIFIRRLNNFQQISLKWMWLSVYFDLLDEDVGWGYVGNSWLRRFTPCGITILIYIYQ